MSDIVERLPCDVLVQPATLIKSGCRISTLLEYIEMRRERSEKGPPLDDILSRRQADEILALRAEVEALRGMLAKTRSAISSLNEGAMGYGAPPFMSTEDQIRHQWPLRDELIAEIDAALSTTEAK